jgi:hypothetical protein
MTRIISLAMMGLAILIATPILMRAKPMQQNQKYLEEAQAHAKKFEAELESERLREAAMALENVLLVQEHDPRTRAQLRTDCLTLWLQLLQLLDRFLDPNFNPEDVPTKLVQPPPTSGGVAYAPGADPALIDDPRARAEYEKAIANNRTKANHYRLQITLRRLEERIPPRAEAFIRNSYTPAPGDQEELKAAIDGIMQNPQRKAGLLKLLTPSQP